MEKEIEILKKILILNNEETAGTKIIEKPLLKIKSLKIDELELETLKLCLKDILYNRAKWRTKLYTRTAAWKNF